MINFILCDDNDHARIIQESIIAKICMPYDFNYRVYQFSRYNTELQNLIEKQDGIKIYILDVEMPGKNGIQIAKEIRKKDWDSIIIIFSQHEELEFKILKQKLLILDFISKYGDYEKALEETLLLALKQYGNKKVLSFKSNRELCNLKYEEILYIYRDNELGKTKIVTEKKEYPVRESIRTIIAKLDDRFIQSHKACYVNKDNITNIDFKNNIIYFKTKKIDLLSRMYKKGLKENYG